MIGIWLDPTVVSQALRNCSPMIFLALLTNVVSNLTLLASPLYMLQVYDRVLASGSIETLAVLTILLALTLSVYACSEFIRSVVHTRMGAKFRQQLQLLAFESETSKSNEAQCVSTNELETVQRFVASGPLSSLLDLPWSLIFLFVLFLVHPMLGVFGAVCGGVICSLGLAANFLVKRHVLSLGKIGIESRKILASAKSNRRDLFVNGMFGIFSNRWKALQDNAVAIEVLHSDLSSVFSAITKTLRMLFQSMALGLGAFLVIQGEITGGTMIAGTILLGKALLPIEKTVSQFASTQRAKYSLMSLAANLAKPETNFSLQLPNSIAFDISIVGLYLPGSYEKASELRTIDIDLDPREFVAIRGGNGSGKSAFLSQLTTPQTNTPGKIFWAGVPLENLEENFWGETVAVVPQTPKLFEGTLIQNITGFRTQVDDEALLRCVRNAGLQPLLGKLQNGLDERIIHGQNFTSTGFVKKIAIARALYKEPSVLILDDPTADLDDEGRRFMSDFLRIHKEKGLGLIVATEEPELLNMCSRSIIFDGGVIVDDCCKDFGLTREMKKI